MFFGLEKFFKSRDNLILAIFSFFLGINSLFFIALVVEQVGFFAFFSVKKIYVIYFFLFLIFGFYQLFVAKKNILSKKFIQDALWVFVPMIAILCYGFSESIKFNVLFKLGTGLYFIVLGFFLIFKNRKYKKISEFWRGEKRKKEKKSWIVGLILIFIVLLNFSFGFYHLSKFAAVDEALWTEGRITKYWNNIVEREWRKTMVSDKPGITVALLTGPGLLFVNPNDYERDDNYGRDFDPPKNVENMNLAFRLPILIFCSLSLFVFYFFLKPLFGRKTSIIAVILMGLSPLLLGISTIINPDSLLWVFVPLTFLAYLNYLKKQSDQWLYLAGILMGLSILTKYVANILYIFFLGMIFWEYIFQKEKYTNMRTRDYLKKFLVDYFILIFISLTVFFLLLPKAWVEAEAFFQATLLSQAFSSIWPFFVGFILLIFLDLFLIKGRIFSFILKKVSSLRSHWSLFILLAFLLLALITFFNARLDMQWFDLESILASPKSAYMTSGLLGMMLANFYSLIFGISPLALLGVVLFLFLAIGNKISKGYFEGITLLLFILVYYLASSLSNVSATVRYQIILYPLIFIISALGIKEVLRMASKKERNSILTVPVVFLIVASLYSLNFIRPFYFSYASSLLPEKYVLNLKDMGDGSYEAAQFLNSLPNPEQIEIWTDKRGVCMFFRGICRSGIGLEKGEYAIDYFVVSSGRESRTTTMTLARYEGGNKKLIRLDELYDEKNPEWKLEIGDRPNNFVKIIKN